MSLKDDYSIQRLCEVLGVPRSSFYHDPRPTENRPEPGAVREWAGQGPTCGYRRLRVMVRRQGHPVRPTVPHRRPGSHRRMTPRNPQRTHVSM